MTDQTDTAVDETGATDPAAVAKPFYCDQCGARYAGPGTCENQHAPAELVEAPVDEAPAETPAETPAAEPAAAKETYTAKDDTDGDEAPPLAEQLPASITSSTSISTSIAGVPYSGTISLSLTKQQA